MGRGRKGVTKIHAGAPIERRALARVYMQPVG